jgi:hypothetical protein
MLLEDISLIKNDCSTRSSRSWRIQYGLSIEVGVLVLLFCASMDISRLSVAEKKL